MVPTISYMAYANEHLANNAGGASFWFIEPHIRGLRKEHVLLLHDRHAINQKLGGRRVVGEMLIGIGM